MPSVPIMKLIVLFSILILLINKCDAINREQIKELLVKKINSFKLDLHKSIESRRIKRSVQDGSTTNGYNVQFDGNGGKLNN